MAADMEMALRGPDAYGLARKATALMEQHGVWPTPMNYELWLNYAGDPKSALANAIDKLIAADEPFTDAVSETLATKYLTRLKISDQIRDAGDQLSRELASVSEAIATAKKSSEAYGKTLAGASKELDVEADPADLHKLVEGLSKATRRAEQQNQTLETQLRASTLEVTRLKEHLEQVRRDAMTDALTKLANRKAFDEALETACQESERTGAPVTLALVDIDHFKKFNDTWGHQTGDQVIRFVASVLARHAEMPRLAARYGGEEFAFLCPAEGAGRVAAVLEEMRKEIGSRRLKRRSTNEELGNVTISTGFAQLRRGESISSFIERTDTALYASKRAGRNRVTEADVLPDAAAA
jgi:diguanylate cyclase